MTSPLLGLVAGLTVALAGCAAVAEGPGTDTATSEAPSATPSEAATETTPVLPVVTSYVAMGDSYTAAPLFPLDDDLLIDDCLRSDQNYPTLVAAELGVDVVDVSCSGASTASMTTPQVFTEKTQPPQLDALTPDVDLVTIGIGANDYTFFSKMIFDCLELADRDVDGAPCREANSTARGVDKLERNVDRIRRNVQGVVTTIRQRAPEARVLLVGYPQIIPTTGTCRPRLPLAIGDYAYTRDLNLALADAVREGGTAAGAEYVDLVAASQGHDICAEEPWVAGIRGKDNRAAGLHPYPAEQEAVAQLVLDQL